MNSRSIGDYALLSDCRTAALVSREGSVDWLCMPRFDGGSVFARMLDSGAGHFSILAGEDGSTEITRRYVADSMVLETTFRTATGTAVLVEAMAVGRTDRGHDLGTGSPGALLRHVTCTGGSIELQVEYAPRPEYGRIEPLLVGVHGGVAARGGASMLMLSAPLRLRIEGSTATGRMELQAGDTAGFALHHRPSWEAVAPVWSQAEIAEELDDTVEGWRSWTSVHQTYDGPWRGLVRHSARVLQALTFVPTGAVVAAPTTSLPELAGGGRSLDYRYTWMRDASLTMRALWVAACPDEADRYFTFLAGAAATQLHHGSDLQVVFGIGGEHDLTERTLPHLTGWRDRRPVRIGNDAWKQRQLDVYGELLGAARRLAGLVSKLDDMSRGFLIAAADAAAARWQEPDHGIWEIRGEPRHFVYSKLMCWQALDCAVDLAGHLGAEDRMMAWAAARDEIRAAIFEHGWSGDAGGSGGGAFTRAFGDDGLDASNLMMAITGFLPGDDPRMRATIDAVAERLTDERGLVHRNHDDGVAGGGGALPLCTFWLAHAWALTGDVDRAKAAFERGIAAANDVGLLAEEVDVASGEQLGNFPLASSHVGLINAACAIAQAEQHRHGPARNEDG